MILLLPNPSFFFLLFFDSHWSYRRYSLLHFFMFLEISPTVDVGLWGDETDEVMTLQQAMLISTLWFSFSRV